MGIIGDMDTFGEYSFKVFVSVSGGSAGERYHRVFAEDGKDHIVAVTR